MVCSDSYELKNDQKEWISNNTEKVYSLLEATPPDGKEFAEIVKSVLSREELWNIWKNDSCPGKVHLDFSKVSYIFSLTIFITTHFLLKF